MPAQPGVMSERELWMRKCSELNFLLVPFHTNRPGPVTKAVAPIPWAMKRPAAAAPRKWRPAGLRGT